MLFRRITFIHFANHAKEMCCGKNTELLNVTAGGPYSLQDVSNS
jgi:hypothetical protein